MFSEFALHERLLKGLEELKFDTPTQVQEAAIPLAIEGNDLHVIAQTGSGKTGAFVLPLLQRLMTEESQALEPRALILLPTRELARQILSEVQRFAKFTFIKAELITGGEDFKVQSAKMRKNPDIIIATPGRALEHLAANSLILSSIQVLVLDEADRMLDMGFIVDIKRIMAKLPAKRQTLLFSATYSSEIKQLADELLNSPQLIEVAATNATAERVEQLAYLVDKHRKRELLSHVIGKNNWPQVLVFVRTKHGADRLAKQLAKDGLKSAAIHGDKSQGARTKALADFKAGTVRILVATDIAARGLDINELPYVVNYDLPQVSEDYVHRIGRTGRAGNSGVALTLITPEEIKALQDIEKLIQQVITATVLPGYEHDPTFVAPEQAQARHGDGPKKPAKKGMLKAKLRAKALGKA
ncbi:MAG: DEAD/DEAH box helicase [Gammaproteobacteria bacterium]|nr:DEAD/DEAH box helicase [Gammaproteobacteria bacterium]